jgi:hypothetical protein
MEIFRTFLKEFKAMPLKDESGKMVRRRSPIRLTTVIRPQTERETQKTTAAIRLLLSELIRQQLRAAKGEV